MTRERRLAATFVELADNLADDFDVVDLMTRLCERCVELLDVAAAGVVLADLQGDLRVMAATSDALDAVEAFQVRDDQGPGRDAFQLGVPVSSTDLVADRRRWPRFAPVATRAGFRAAHSLPMRLRGEIPLGVLSLVRAEPGGLGRDDLETAQALADVTTIALLQNRALRDAHLVADQLQDALDSRVAIEQAKGVVSARLSCDIDTAFALLRGHARAGRLRLSAVAEGVIAGVIPPQALADARP